MPITYPATQLTVKVELLGIVTAGVWTDISHYVLYDSQVVIQRGQGIEDKADGTPNTITLTLNNVDRRFSPRNVSGPYYGRLKQNTRCRVSYDAGTGLVQRAEYEIPDFAPNRKAGSLPTLRIEAVDKRKRYARSAPPLNSPIYASTIAAHPVAYAALEESNEATRVTLSSTTGSVASSGVIDFAGDEGLLGAKTAVKLTANSFISLNSTGHFFAGHWQVDWFMKIPAAPAADTRMMMIYSSGTLVRWDFVVGPGSYRLRGVDNTGAAVIDTGPFALSGVFINQWMHVRVMLNQTSATNYDYLLVTFPADLSALGAALSGSTTGSVGGASRAQIEPQTGMDGVSLGQLAIYDAYNFSAVDGSGDGYSGEHPTDRFLRLCAEEGIPAVVRSNGTDDVMMGVQKSDDFMANVRECLIANEGFLDTDTAGKLRMTSRTYVENRAVAMTIDHSLFRSQDLDVADTTKLLVNKFTASRSGGGSVTASADSGPLNANDPEVDLLGVGAFPDSETYNLSSDAALPDHAGIRVYRGTIDHPTVEKITIHFARSGVAASLLATWLTMDTFQRINITNPPGDFGPDTLDQIIIGITERITQKELVIELACRPAAGFTVDVLEDDNRLDSQDTRLLHALTTTDTSVRIFNAGTEVDSTLWDHRDGDYKIKVTGEDMNVTAVSGLNAPAGASFIAAGTGASASSGSITPGLPAGMQKGDAILLFASTRNAGTGTVATPTGYTRMLDVDNMSIFGKQHTGSESAPLVSFTNGAANEDTMAQMCAFRNVSLFAANGTTARVLKSSIALNVSAQNILLPASVLPIRRNTVAIYLAWKQDDWTTAGSIGSPPTRIGTVVSTAGNDAAMVWDYDILTDPKTSIAGFWTITGGASALSNSAVLFLDANVQILTVTRSTNTAVMTHSTGEQVRVRNPIILGLPST